MSEEVRSSPVEIERDEEADEAAVAALRSEIVATRAVAGTAEPVDMPNTFLHAPRELTAWQQERLATLKNLALALNIELHTIDGSDAAEQNFYSRELDQAALRLEEALLWAEKHFRM